jgi:6-phosphogluconolactonase
MNRGLEPLETIMSFPLCTTLLAAAAFLASASAARAADSDKYWVFFGTYTGGKSQGIYRSEFDAKTGILAPPELAAQMGSPSFLAIHPTNRFLYAVGEGGEKDGGPVAAFALDARTGVLTKLNELTSGGPGPCHVAIDRAGQFALVANYGGGSCAAFRLGDDGKLAARTSFVQHTGSSVNKSRQETPHAHCGAFDRTGNYAFVVDLGLDQVLVYGMDRGIGVLRAYHSFKMPSGSGPRHIALASSNDLAYVCGEIDSTVNVVRFDLTKGVSETVQSLSTLPEPVSGNSTAECVLHPTGKFVYVSNRGHNSVAVFKVGADGRLTAAGHITGDIKTPRNFNIDPTGRWMLIASQDADHVGVFEIEPSTGMAKETKFTVVVGRPVCVKFVPVAK